MHFQEAQSAGPAPTFREKLPDESFESLTLPFAKSIPLSAIGGPTYLTSQALVQQVAFTLSDKVFTYSPETFDLDVALRQWHANGDENAFGYVPGVLPMDIRRGAGSVAMGYMFSKDFDLKKRHIPQQIVASSSTLGQLRPSLDELTLLYQLSNPLVMHIAAVDYSPNSSSGLITDYVSALQIANDLDLGLVSSASAFEVQHMSLLATLLASVVPTVHIYDGINLARETIRIVDAMDKHGLQTNYTAITASVSPSERKHLDKEGQVARLMRSFNDELGTQYQLFEYHGHQAAETVLVVFGSIEAALAKQAALALAKSGVRVGVINVRVYRPFVEDEFISAIPTSARIVAVLGQVKDRKAVEDSADHSILFTDVLAALTFQSQFSMLQSVEDIKYDTASVWTLDTIASIFGQIPTQVAGGIDAYVPNDDYKISLDDSDRSMRKYSFWDLDESASTDIPVRIAQLLATESERNISLRTGHDNLIQGGAVRTDVCSSAMSLEASYAAEAVQVAFVGHEKLLEEFDILNNLETGGALIVNFPITNETDLEKRFTVGTRKGIAARKARLFLLDPNVEIQNVESHQSALYLSQAAFLEVAGEDLSSRLIPKLAEMGGDKVSFNAILDNLDKALRQAQVPESWATIEPEVESVSLPTSISVNSFAAFERVDPDPPTQLESWISAAKGLTFKEAYGTSVALRPDLGIKTSIIHVKERRRLTPLTYDRNIFHIEFDLGDSGLTYAIGEALGIHAENDKTEVEEFIKWYGLDADEIFQVPSREDPTVMEARTVFQALVQNVDIFGRPPKRFYEVLSAFATDETERQNMLMLSTAEGATEFKRRAEMDTITFADILLEFPSAHPSFHDLVRIVNPMKRREYSIASSQKVTPNSVSLLIVTVGWVDPRGRSRFGQATRYLNGLQPGAPVTVSVKPSVMKLPQSTSSPIIMAGLGTGLAPFRAFVQERALQKQQGENIGSVLLYMGSRHQREEYLYGEEWEAYQKAGVISLLGRAFSRDQPQKVYIQDRMRQTLDDIRQAYLKDQGSFYLCGPTWPVPDVTQVLQEALEVEAKSLGKKVDSRREIETLKDLNRYVLEVY